MYFIKQIRVCSNCEREEEKKRRKMKGREVGGEEEECKKAQSHLHYMSMSKIKQQRIL
jgi:hypothetical protein